MKSQRSVSVVLAGYNEEKNIERAMQESYDALAENFEKFELILIDDASKDSTFKKMSEFAAKNKNTIFIPNLINLNFGTSVLRGMMAATNDYVTFNACDLPLKTEDMVRLLTEMPDDVDVLIMERRNYLTTKWREITSNINKILLKMLFPRLTRGTPVLNYTQIYKREKLDFILPLARSPIFVWPELIFRSKLIGLKWINEPVECNVQNLRKGAFGHPHDIIWGIYEMLRFRIWVWRNKRKR